MKDTLKKLIVIALISVSFIAIFLPKYTLATSSSGEQDTTSDSEEGSEGEGVLPDNRTYRVNSNDVVLSEHGGIAITTMVPTGKNEPMGLVVMCHGYSGSRRGDGDAFLRLGKILARNGIAAVTLDFPGCGDSPQPSTKYDLTEMKGEIDTVISYMEREYPNIDPAQIGICGHSMGGRVASLYLPNVKVAALWAPANGEGDKSYEFMPKINFTPSGNFVSEMRSSDPNGEIRKFTGPLLLAYGSDDREGKGSSPLSPETVNAATQAFNDSNSVKKVSMLNLADSHNFDANRGELIQVTADLFCNYFVGHDARIMEEDIYNFTIEDFVYNRVPILDVNVFSEYAGGEKVPEDSATAIIKQLVSTWYVAVRNAIVVVLGILLIYSATRMAISTVASDRAEYKEFMIGWLKSVIILFTIHYVIYAILYINDTLVNMFSKGKSTESEMYQTIKTRASDIRASVFIPGSIMYLTLSVIKYRFAWLYIKRFFTVIILIITAPFIAGKYAFDSASGKKSQAFSGWLYQFGSNVLIQAAHALLYVAIVGTSLDLSSQSITSFIIALVFLNFMISADKIVLRLFKFDKPAQEIQKPFKAKEDLSGVFYAYGAVKLAKGALKSGKDYANYLGHTKYLKGTVTKAENITGKALTAVDNGLLRIGKGASNAVQRVTGKKGKGKKSLATKILILRKASRRKGTAGEYAKQTLSLKISGITSRFTSGYKFIKNDVVGVGQVILAIPVGVVNPGTGIGLFTRGVKNLGKNAKSDPEKHYNFAENAVNVVTLGQYKNRKEDHEKAKKSKTKIDKVIDSMIDADATMEEIEREINKLDPKSRDEAKKALKTKLKSEEKNVEKYMYGFMGESESSTLTEEDVMDMVEDVVRKLGEDADLSEKQINDVLGYAKTDIQGLGFALTFNTNEGGKVSKCAESVSKAVIKATVESRFNSLLDKLDTLEKESGEVYRALTDATEDEDQDILDVNEFVDKL